MVFLFFFFFFARFEHSNLIWKLVYERFFPFCKFLKFIEHRSDVDTPVVEMPLMPDFAADDETMVVPVGDDGHIGPKPPPTKQAMPKGGKQPKANNKPKGVKR